MILLGNRRREPPSVSSVTQHVLRGTLEIQVQADIAYTVEGQIKFHLGPVFLVLKGKEAALSMRELIDKLAPVIDELYPDLVSTVTGNDDVGVRSRHNQAVQQQSAATAPYDIDLVRPLKSSELRQ